jgi:hypothetical protein
MDMSENLFVNQYGILLVGMPKNILPYGPNVCHTISDVWHTKMPTNF